MPRNKSDVVMAASVRQLIRAATSRLPERVLPTLRANRSVRWLARRYGPPQLSVIVPVYNVAEYLSECLDSLLGQTLQRLEIIAVDDGSTDISPQILATYAKADRRIKVITQANAGLGAARNAGIAVATAPFLTFLDSDDTVPSTAYAQMVGTLRRTGSDFAVGAVRRVALGRYSRPAWVLNVHQSERLHITIDDFPDAMQDVIACNRVFRRVFWNERIGPFPTGIAYEDHAPMVAAYVRADAFDILATTTYNWRIRENATSIGQQKHETQNLIDRIAVKDLAWDVVSKEASRVVRAAWLGRVFDIDLSLFVQFAVTADEKYREILRLAITRFLERIGPDAWRHVRVERKLRIALAAAGAWKQVDRVIEYFRVNGAIPETRVADGRVYAELPFAGELGLAQDLYELSDHQTRLSGCVQRVEWDSAGRLIIDGWAFISGIDLSDKDPVIQAVLTNLETGMSRLLPVERYESGAVTRWANHPNHRYDSAAFRAVIDVDTLLDDPPNGSVKWQLLVKVEADGVERKGSLHGIVRSGMGKRFIARDLEPSGWRRFVPAMDDRLGFSVLLREEGVRATWLSVEGESHLVGALTGSPGSGGLSHVFLSQGGERVAKARLVEQPTGAMRFAIAPPVDKLNGTPLTLAAVDRRGKRRRVSWLPESGHPPEIGGYGPGHLRWSRSPTGLVEVATEPYVLRATDVAASAVEVTVEVRCRGLPEDLLRQAVLRDSSASVDLSRLEPIANDRFRLVFPLTARRWGSDVDRPLPTGTYSIYVPTDGETLACVISEDLLGAFPVEKLTKAHGITFGRVPGDLRMTIALRPPLRETERSRVMQRRMAVTYASRTYTPLDQVYFQCYRGEFASDSQRAIHDELLKRGSPLKLVWGVYDLSTDLPDNAEPVIIGSQEWLNAVGGSRYLCHNIDFDRFFARRPFQRFLQTFHGYPFKSMGVSFWRAKGFSEDLIEEECARRNSAWTSIVVPEAFCEEIYRREYRYTGQVLITGYPRNDALVTPDEGARDRILGRLGIPVDKTVVLYAPTWREKVATGAWSAILFQELDLEELSASLGPDYVLLMRGHNYNLRAGAITMNSATVIDVTRYPEINDLILAADVAILDYSSLRFDWALTGKPMIFFVPDLAEYLSQRSGLFDYGSTAPGPMLSATSDVASALSDLDAISADYSAALKEFNSTFNRMNDGHATQRVVDAFFGADAI